MAWHKISRIIESGPDEMITTIKVEGRRVCIFRNENMIYAVQNRCPHAGGFLCDGWITEGKIVCPNHQYKYDIKTGRGQYPQGDFIFTFPVKVEKEHLYIDIPISWNPWRWLMNLFR